MITRKAYAMKQQQRPVKAAAHGEVTAALGRVLRRTRVRYAASCSILSDQAIQCPLCEVTTTPKVLHECVRQTR